MDNKNKDLIVFITNYRNSHNIAPSLDELASHVNLSKQAVARRVKILISLGVLKRSKAHRSLEVVK